MHIFEGTLSDVRAQLSFRHLRNKRKDTGEPVWMGPFTDIHRVTCVILLVPLPHSMSRQSRLSYLSDPCRLLCHADEGYLHTLYLGTDIQI